MILAKLQRLDEQTRLKHVGSWRCSGPANYESRREPDPRHPYQRTGALGEALDAEKLGADGVLERLPGDEHAALLRGLAGISDMNHSSLLPGQQGGPRWTLGPHRS